jgi:hypothetical protein
MTRQALLLIALGALAATAGPAHAQAVPPISLTQLPHVSIISPVFYWSDAADVVRMASATCPKGRPIAGGVAIQKGSASLRIQETYPDGESWVTRIVNRKTPDSTQPLEVRAFAVCLLPSARVSSIQLSQFPRLTQQSQAFSIPPGGGATGGRAVCPSGTLVISGGFGLDPKSQGSGAHIEQSFPDTAGWNVKAASASTPQAAAEARSYAICLGSGEGLSIQDYRSVDFVDAEVALKPDAGAVRQAIKCRSASSHAIGGGARLVRGKNAAIELQESFPDSPSSWTVALANRADRKAGDARVKLYAVCMNP